MARGAVPEDNLLSVTGGNRQPLLDNADLIIIIGHESNWLDEWWQYPTFNQETDYVQIQDSPDTLFVGLSTKLSIIGSSKLVLRQIIDAVKPHVGKAKDKSEWLNTLSEAKAKQQSRQEKRLAQVRDDKPINPDALADGIANFLDPSATVIYDSFTASSFLTDRFQARFAGQILDSALQGGVGHSPGVAIGAQLGRPGKQVLALIGDGGMGVGGMDIETAVRYNLPCVFVVYNNSSWGGFCIPKDIFWPECDSWCISHGIRYDTMFEACGCHGEHVEESKDVRPALERAFNSGKTAVINVVGDSDVPHPVILRCGLIEAWSRGLDTMPKEAHDYFLSMGKREIIRTSKWLRECGFDVSPEDLYEIIGKEPK